MPVVFASSLGSFVIITLSSLCSLRVIFLFSKLVVVITLVWFYNRKVFKKMFETAFDMEIVSCIFYSREMHPSVTRSRFHQRFFRGTLCEK